MSGVPCISKYPSTMYEIDIYMNILSILYRCFTDIIWILYLLYMNYLELQRSAREPTAPGTDVCISRYIISNISHLDAFKRL